MLATQNKKLDAKLTVKKIPDFEYGVIWEDPISGHKIGCLDVSKKEDVEKLMHGEKAILAIQDPPYNVDINDEFGNLPLEQYINWSGKWVDNTIDILGIAGHRFIDGIINHFPNQMMQAV